MKTHIPVRKLVPMNKRFFGWRVVAAAFVLAVFGWGVGFYGPPVFLQTVREARGWSVAIVSTAVTTHFLIGALVVANLPKLYRLFGVPLVTKLAAVSLAVGVAGWSLAAEPWQLFVATLFSGAGWVGMGAAAINAIVATWFARARPAALAMAYNGASIGGVIFAPLWVAAIGWLGFPMATMAIGAVMVVAIWILADLFFAATPSGMGLTQDGDAVGAPLRSVTSPLARPLPGPLLWRDPRFLTLAAGMACGLFAQIGLLAHLYSLLVPVLGAGSAGILLGTATAVAIVGRTSVGWMMPVGADRRLWLSFSYAVQVAGSLGLLLAGGNDTALLILGVLLFGLGIGNATSVPPLIAQVEFVKEDVARVVPLIVAMSQAGYAFAPALFGLLRDTDTAPRLFIAAATIQMAAILVMLLGRRR